jgi:hypothetical protein
MKAYACAERIAHAMQRWEYCVLSFNQEKGFLTAFKRASETIEVADYLTTIEELGLNGWELVAVNANNYGTTYTFKRPLS